MTGEETPEDDLAPLRGIAPRDRETVRGALSRAQQSEEELREVAERMAEAQQIACFGNWEWTIDTDRVAWSDELIRIFGTEPGTFEATFDAYVERIHDDDREWVVNKIKGALENTEPYLMEHRILHVDGSTRNLRCHGQAVKDSSGKVQRLVGVCQDVTELAEAEAARQTADLRFRNAFDHALIGVALVSIDRPEAELVQVNRALCSITGFEEADLVGNSLGLLTAPEDWELDAPQRERLTRGDLDAYATEMRWLHKEGHRVWCQLSFSVIPPGDGTGRIAIVQVQDISERRRFEQRLQYLADHDSLTGLVNRRRFSAELEQQIAFNDRYGGQGAVLIIDIDRFKLVNDTLGHQAGDNLLRRVSALLTERVRATDSVARLSGDEFAVLMPQVNPAGARALAESISEVMHDRAGAETGAAQVTASIGIAIFGAKADSEAVLASADMAMYHAKEEGRDQTKLFEDIEEASELRERGQTSAAKIRDALRKEELTLYQQPILDLRSGEVERRELLLRLTGSDGEAIPARLFIETAENTGMIQELDRWVIERALSLQGDSEGRGEPAKLHVNISGASISDLGVVEFIERALDEGDADPKKITFEITETAAIHNLELAQGFADRLSEFGCELAIDDYGAGFGPFYYLKHLQFDLIKIDGDFVRDLPRNDADRLTVQAIVQIATGLGKRTIAESVEDEETAVMLKEYGVDMAQGFHMGHPAALNGNGVPRV